MLVSLIQALYFWVLLIIKTDIMKAINWKDGTTTFKNIQGITITMERERAEMVMSMENALRKLIKK